MERISRRCREIQTTIAERDRDQSQFRKIKNSTTEQTELNDFKESPKNERGLKDGGENVKCDWRH